LEGLGYTIMALIDEQAVPWRNSQNKIEIAWSKEEFLKLDEGFVPPKFLGIHEYLKECRKMKYEDQPNYKKLKELIQKLF
jgi:hypothetical protein